MGDETSIFTIYQKTSKHNGLTPIPSAKQKADSHQSDEEGNETQKKLIGDPLIKPFA